MVKITGILVNIFEFKSDVKKYFYISLEKSQLPRICSFQIDISEASWYCKNNFTILVSFCFQGFSEPLLFGQMRKLAISIQSSCRISVSLLSFFPPRPLLYLNQSRSLEVGLELRNHFPLVLI